MSESTFWNGEPVNAAKGEATSNGEPVRIVRVYYNGNKYDLDDSDGQAWAKVTIGCGSPRYGHRSIYVDPHSFEPDDWSPIIQETFDRLKSEGEATK